MNTELVDVSCYIAAQVTTFSILISHFPILKRYLRLQYSLLYSVNHSSQGAKPRLSRANRVSGRASFTLRFYTRSGPFV